MSAPAPVNSANLSRSTTRFITAMKLRELRRQRETLRHAYRALGESAAEDDAPAVRLRRMYHGLRALRSAGQPLHPEVVNLEILLREADAGAASEAVVTLWRERLESEAASGRLRSEFVYLFGALLEEWTRETGGGNAAARDEAARATKEMREIALSAPEPNRHRPLFDALFDDMGPSLSAWGEALTGRLTETLGKFPRYDLETLLERLGRDVYQTLRLRTDARRFAASAPLRKELADALTILTGEREAWDWPSEGFTARARWARIRWRLYLNADLPTVCLLESLGKGWQEVFEERLAAPQSASSPMARLRKLVEMHAPGSILEAARRDLPQGQQALGPFEGEEPADLWEFGLPDEEEGDGPRWGSVVTQREEAIKEISQASREAYEGDYSESAANPVVRLVHAEVQLARAAFPDRPLYVVKADLRDFYARIPHDVLLTILERLGVSAVDREFVARFLSPPIRADRDAEPIRARRGVPMNFTLSALLADLLLRLMERYVRQGAPRVRILRQIDDICLLTPHADDALSGWRRIGEFCAAVGLEVNAEKSGAVCLGGTLPDGGLPTALPRWGMIELGADGAWRVHRETFAAYAERSRERAKEIPSLLGRVQAYNTDAQYLLNALSLGAALGDTHRAEAFDAVRDFHHAFFGPGRGVTSGLRDEILQRFPPDIGGDARADAIPDGWLYWPLTAGGLGLKNPLLIAGQFAQAYDSREKPVAPDASARTPDWERASNEWAAYYRRLLLALEVGEPEETRVMETLVKDFVARGAEITSGAQTDLSAYWKWVLYTYGPQILQRFGTFRFLITELVPLQLISQQRVESSSQSADGADETGDLEIPF
jgi:hypothetical protein